MKFINLKKYPDPETMKCCYCARGKRCCYCKTKVIRLNRGCRKTCGCLQRCQKKVGRCMMYLAGADNIDEEEDNDTFSLSEEDDATSCWEKTRKFFKTLGHNGSHLVTIAYLHPAILLCGLFAVSCWPPYWLFYINTVILTIGLICMIKRWKAGVLFYDMYNLTAGAYQFLHGTAYSNFADSIEGDDYDLDNPVLLPTYTRATMVGEALCGVFMIGIAPFRIMWWTRYKANADHFTGKDASRGVKF